MKHIVRKFFSIGAFEEEEQWLNQMAAKGMILTGVGFCKYFFEEGTPGEYVYRLELLKNWPSHTESIAYISFLEDMGIEQVGSHLRWVYFRRKSTEGAFDIFSDIDSRISHYQRITRFSFVMSAMMAILAVVFFGEAGNFIFNHNPWIQSGFHDSFGYSIIFLAYGVMFTLFAALFPFVTRPIRASLRALLRERQIRE